MSQFPQNKMFLIPKFQEDIYHNHILNQLGT